MTQYNLSFEPASAPIRNAVTKFGGQPAWIEEPAWPLSLSTGQPMRFIGQVALESRVVGRVQARMAYIFITDLPDAFVDDTWDANGGENAVVLQPGTYDGPSVPVASGPTLYRMVPGGTPGRRVPEACEFAVVLEPPTENSNTDDTNSVLEGTKIGGAPAFIQGPEYPDDSEAWRLLLQLDSTDVPFFVNFGDAGVGYVFLSEDGKRAGFLWQCS